MSTEEYHPHDSAQKTERPFWLRCIFGFTLCLTLLFGAWLILGAIVRVTRDHPSSPQQRAQQIKASVQKAGGEGVVLEQSKVLFEKLSHYQSAIRGLPMAVEDPCFKDIGGITNLGDVFYYQTDRVKVRIHNSHFDTFFVYIWNPDTQPAKDYKQIIGNVGFLEH